MGVGEKALDFVAEPGGFFGAFAFGDDADDGFGVGGAEVDPGAFELPAEVELGAVADGVDMASDRRRAATPQRPLRVVTVDDSDEPQGAGGGGSFINSGVGIVGVI